MLIIKQSTRPKQSALITIFIFPPDTTLDHMAQCVIAVILTIL